MNALIKKTNEDYYSGIIQESSNNPRTLFSTVNKLLHKGVPAEYPSGVRLMVISPTSSLTPLVRRLQFCETHLTPHLILSWSPMPLSISVPCHVLCL